MLFTGVPDVFFALRAWAEPQTPVGPVAGSQAGVLWAGVQAPAAHLTDGGSIFSFPLNDLF